MKAPARLPWVRPERACGRSRETESGAPFFSARFAEDDAGWWSITFSDLTLLLLGFLACWYVVGQASPAKTKQKGDAPARSVTRAEPAANFPPKAAAWDAIGQDLADFIARAGLSEGVTVESKIDEVVLSLKDTIPFASGQAALRPRALPVLEKVAGAVIAHPELSVAISGHTDSLRIATAEFPSNWELSTARASRVARYMVERGVHPSRIAVQGFADRRPLRSNATPADRSANRRVEIRLFHETTEPSAASVSSQ